MLKNEFEELFVRSGAKEILGKDKEKTETVKVLFEVDEKGRYKKEIKGKICNVTIMICKIIIHLAELTKTKPTDVIEVLKKLAEIDITMKGGNDGSREN